MIAGAAELDPSWRSALAEELASPWFASLSEKIAHERAQHSVFPPENEVFRALSLTPLTGVRVVLLGQDPYHGAGQAHGLCFSVPRGIKPPPSLRNILRELSDDLAVPAGEHGDLSAWAERGMLMLNSVLTVREGQAGSHQKLGWERFTDAVISAVSARPTGAVFVLWGNPARAKAALIDRARHRVIEGVHPSPLSAHRGFFGSRPFSALQRALAELGQPGFEFRRP